MSEESVWEFGVVSPGAIYATVLGTMESYLREALIACGRRKDLPWGGVPIIILVGDDFQLPSVSP